MKNNTGRRRPPPAPGVRLRRTRCPRAAPAAAHACSTAAPQLSVLTSTPEAIWGESCADDASNAQRLRETEVLMRRERSAEEMPGPLSLWERVRVRGCELARRFDSDIPSPRLSQRERGRGAEARTGARSTAQNNATVPSDLPLPRRKGRTPPRARRARGCRAKQFHRGAARAPGAPSNMRKRTHRGKRPNRCGGHGMGRNSTCFVCAERTHPSARSRGPAAHEQFTVVAAQ